MHRAVKMFCRVFIFRTIATANVTARFAKAQVNPIVTDFQTIFAAVCAWRNRFDRIEMRALLCHSFNLFLFFV
jgi:hypothetical protein